MAALVALPLALLPAPTPQIPGLIGAVGMVLQMEAVQRTAVVHVIAVKRMSTLLSAAIGGFVLGEPRPDLRVPAGALMLAGAGLVLLSPAS